MQPRVVVEQVGHVLTMGLNRPDKRNAADFALLVELAAAYGRLESDPELRAGLVYANGDDFTAGLDLTDIGPRLVGGSLDFVPPGGADPWRISDNGTKKPIVTAVHGVCLTLGIELMLAADIAVAAASTRFGQIEVSRGILPFGGATIRLPRAVGWGNAMRWLLTGDMFDANEADRMGLVQEVVPDGEAYQRGLEIAERVARQAPLAVQATLENARLAISETDASAQAALTPSLARLAASDDARIGMESFLTRTPAEFTGR